MSNIVYPHGELLVVVPELQKVQVYSRDIVQVYKQEGFPNHPPNFKLLYTTQPEETFTSDQFSVTEDTLVKINAGATDVLYAIGTTPIIPNTISFLSGWSAPAANLNSSGVTIQPGMVSGSGINGSILFSVPQLSTPVTIGVMRTVTSKTVSVTLTAAEVKNSIITVNQGAGAASALQLPTAAAMDAAFFDFAGNHTFEFTLINTSVVAAETASITTNTGWALVGAMDVPAYSAAGSLNSSGLFWARKTGLGAWSLYRVG